MESLATISNSNPRKCLLVCDCVYVTAWERSTMVDAQQFDCWRLLLANDKDACEALLEVTQHALLGYSQHSKVTHCTTLMSAIIQHLSISDVDTSQRMATLDAALDAVKVLAISKHGQQVLINHGACAALCDLIPHTMKAPDGLPKKPRLQGVNRQLLRVTQLLVILLLESGHRPAPGSLQTTSTTAALTALTQVLHSPDFKSLGTPDQQTLAAVAARLSMEVDAACGCPCQQQASSSADLVLSAQQHSQQPGVCQGSAFSTLLGESMRTEQAAEQFLTLHWEKQPKSWLLAVPQEGLTGDVPSADSLRQQQNDTADQAGTDGLQSNDYLSSIFHSLTEERLFDQLIAEGYHSPEMDVDETDPVNYLLTAYQQGELLQALQMGRDVHIIRASAADTDAHDVSGSSTAAEQVLVLPGLATVSDIKAAVAQGFSIVVRDMSKRNAAIARLVDDIELQLGLPAGANLYYTPQGSQALKAHYDDHCVVVVQLCGSKVWQVACSQQHVLPFTYTTRHPVSLGSADQQQQLILQPGYCLYIPRGWVHQAKAVDAACRQEAAGCLQQHTAAPTGSQCITAAGGSGAPRREQQDVANEGGCREGSCTRQHVSNNLAMSGGSLHLSIGIEVEAWFSVQGYLHCLLQTSAIHCIRQCQLGIFPSQIPGSWNAPAAGCSTSSLPEPAQVVCSLACAVVALLLHLLLVQHASHHTIYRRACPMLIKDDNARQMMAKTFIQQLAVADGALLQQHPLHMAGQQSWADEALQHLLPDSKNEHGSVKPYSWHDALQQLNSKLPDVQQYSSEHMQKEITREQPHFQSINRSPQVCDAGLSSSACCSIGLNMGSNHSGVHDDASDDAGNLLQYAADLSSALEWIQRVTITACTTADRLIEGTPRADPPLDEAKVIGAHSEQHAADCIYAGCSAGHGMFSIKCYRCWELAADVLGASTSIKKHGLNQPALNAELLSMVWRQVLRSIHCREIQECFTLAYLDESGRKRKARRLVRHAHLSLLPSTGDLYNPV